MARESAIRTPRTPPHPYPRVNYWIELNWIIIIIITIIIIVIPH